MVVRVNVEFLAKNANEAAFRGDLIVVIDVLRFGSSILNAFANGAEAIIPVRTLKEAYEIHAEHPEYLIAGERGGLRPRGFDLGNSPLEFTGEKVLGKTIVYTTTSGTYALARSLTAKHILVGVFLNARSAAITAMHLAEREGFGISIIQSGAKGQFSLEDFVCAGTIIDNIPKDRVDLSDEAYASVLASRQAKEHLFENILMSKHARNLTNLGFEKDIEFSCRLDLFTAVPVYRNGFLRVMGSKTC